MDLQKLHEAADEVVRLENMKPSEWIQIRKGEITKDHGYTASSEHSVFATLIAIQDYFDLLREEGKI